MSGIRLVAVALLAMSAAACVAQQPGNPPGTAAERSLDRAAGTNTSGAYPMQSDGLPGNPPGIAPARSLARTAGTNTSGAYPMQSDGMPGNPPGTAAGRTVDRAIGTTTTR